MSTERQESKLIRNLGFWDLMAIAVGQIIGAGIMSSTGVAIGMTGTGVVLAFLISPFLTIISIFPVAILSSAVPTTGGPYRYCSRLINKGFGMIYLLLHVTSYSVAVSQYALSFGAYFSSIVPSVNQHLAAMVILTLFYAMNLTGAKSAALLNKIISFALFGGLGLFVLFGLPKTDFSYVMNPANMFPNGPLMFVSTLALLSSATAGAQFIAELGGEAKDAGRTIPKVMVASTFGVGVFYVLIALVAAGVLPMDQVANQPLTLVAEATMPKVAMYLFVIGAALGATSSTLNSTLAWITNSLLCKLMVCVALFALAAKHGDILQRSTLKISAAASKVLAVVGIVILCVLSYSLFASLSGAVVIFLAALVAVSLVYVQVFTKNLNIENDLIVDYSAQKK